MEKTSFCSWVILFLLKLSVPLNAFTSITERSLSSTQFLRFAKTSAGNSLRELRLRSTSVVSSGMLGMAVYPLLCPSNSKHPNKDGFKSATIKPEINVHKFWMTTHKVCFTEQKIPSHLFHPLSWREFLPAGSSNVLKKYFCAHQEWWPPQEQPFCFLGVQSPFSPGWKIWKTKMTKELQKQN